MDLYPPFLRWKVLLLPELRLTSGIYSDYRLICSVDCLIATSYPGRLLAHTMFHVYYARPNQQLSHYYVLYS